MPGWSVAHLLALSYRLSLFPVELPLMILAPVAWRSYTEGHGQPPRDPGDPGYVVVAMFGPLGGTSAAVST